jgi:hypothetical protein
MLQILRSREDHKFPTPHRALARSGNAKCQCMPHAPPKVLLHLTLVIDSLSLHPGRTDHGCC